MRKINPTYVYAGLVTFSIALNWIFHRRDIRGFAQELANPQLSSPCNFQVNQSINLPSIIKNNHLVCTTHGKDCAVIAVI